MSVISLNNAKITLSLISVQLPVRTLWPKMCYSHLYWLEIWLCRWFLWVCSVIGVQTHYNKIVPYETKIINSTSLPHRNMFTDTFADESTKKCFLFCYFSRWTPYMEILHKHTNELYFLSNRSIYFTRNLMPHLRESAIFKEFGMNASLLRIMTPIELF